MSNSNEECLCEAIFGFQRVREQAEVRAFYGNAVYVAIQKWEEEQRQIRAARNRMLLFGTDDVGGQWRA